MENITGRTQGENFTCCTNFTDWPTAQVTNDRKSHYLTPTGMQMFLFYLDIYFTPVVVVTGVVGNTISWIILLKSKLKTFSSSHYLVAICIVNTSYLVTPCLEWLNRTQGINMIVKPGLCQVLSFLEDSSIFLSNWFVVAFFIDRYISLCWPTEGMRLCTKVRARIVIIGLFILSTVIYINLTITKGVVEHPEKNTRHCRKLPFFNHDIKLLFIVEVLLNILLPYSFILLLAVLILRRMYTQHRRNSYSEDSSPLLLKQTTFVFLLTFTFLHCPNEIYHATFYIRLVADQNIRRSVWEKNTQLLLLHAFHLSLVLHLVVYLTTNTLFRNYLTDNIVKFFRSLVTSKCSHIYGGSGSSSAGDNVVHGKYDKVEIEFTATTTAQEESAI